MALYQDFMYELVLSSRGVDGFLLTCSFCLLNRYIMGPLSNRMGRPLVADGGDSPQM